MKLAALKIENNWYHPLRINMIKGKEKNIKFSIELNFSYLVIASWENPAKIPKKILTRKTPGEFLIKYPSAREWVAPTPIISGRVPEKSFGLFSRIEPGINLIE